MSVFTKCLAGVMGVWDRFGPAIDDAAGGAGDLGVAFSCRGYPAHLGNTERDHEYWCRHESFTTQYHSFRNILVAMIMTVYCQTKMLA